MHCYPALKALGPIIAGCAGLITLASCSSSKFHPENSVFLPEASRLQSARDVPFKKSWRTDNLDWSRYDKIVIAPVSVEHLHHSEKIAADPARRAARDEAAAELAAFAREAFKETFSEDRKNRFAVVDAATPGSVICEIAITEFTPARPLVNAAATGLAMAGSVVREIAMNAGGAAAKTSSRGVIAIEVQFKDATTGETVLMFADRERGRPSLVNIKDFQRLGHAKSHIRRWAQQSLAVINKKPLQRILDPLPIDLKPW